MSLIERRQPAFTAELFLRVGLVWLVVSMIFVISSWQAIISMVLSEAALTETLAPAINPLLMMGAAMLLASRLSWRLLGSEFIFPTALILALATPVTIQFQPLRIGSDGWQIVAVLAAINGLTARELAAGWRVQRWDWR